MNSGLFTYGANVLSDGERFMAGSQQWEIDYNRTSATGLACGCYAMRRRRKEA